MRIFGVLNGLADVAERGIDRGRHRVNRGRLPLADDHHARAAVGLEITNHGVKDLGVPAFQRDGSREFVQPVHRDAERPGERGGDGADIAAANHQSIIGVHASDRQHAFDGVDATHLLMRGIRGVESTLRCPVASEAICGGMRGQRVGIEADHDVGLIEHRVDALGTAEGNLGSGTFLVAGDRLPFVPCRLRKGRLELCSHAIHARTSTGFGQHRETGAASLAKIDSKSLVRPRLERRSVRGLPVLMDLTTPLRVVCLQDSTLRDGVARAHVGRVRCIALELDRTTVDAFDQQTLCHAAPLARGREVNRTAGNSSGRTRGVGNDVRFGNPTAGCDAESSQRKRGPHHLHEVTAVLTFEKVGVRRKLTVHPSPEFVGVLKIVETAPVGAS